MYLLVSKIDIKIIINDFLGNDFQINVTINTFIFSFGIWFVWDMELGME